MPELINDIDGSYYHAEFHKRGHKIEVNVDDYGLVHIRIDNNSRAARINLTEQEAKEYLQREWGIGLRQLGPG